MPQFDFSTFPSQIFWLAICFAALYVLLSRVVMPRIGDILNERQERIDGDLDRAASLKAETEKAIETYEVALAEARAKAQVVLKKNHDEIVRKAEARSQELAEELGRRIKEGEAAIEKAKTAALGQIRDIASETAKSAAEKLAGIKVTDKALDSAIGAAMKERG